MSGLHCPGGAGGQQTGNRGDAKWLVSWRGGGFFSVSWPKMKNMFAGERGREMNMHSCTNHDLLHKVKVCYIMLLIKSKIYIEIILLNKAKNIFKAAKCSQC